MNPSAIETRYAGHHFRSRLEARWAVFFNALNIEWLYEPEGYEVGLPGHRRRYLPDFFLPAGRIWVEVKGTADAIDVDLLDAALPPDTGLPLSLNPDDQRQAIVHDRILMLGPVPPAPRFHWALCWAAGEAAWQTVAPVCMSPVLPNQSHRHFFTAIGHPKARKLTSEGRHILPGDVLGGHGYGFTCSDIDGAYVAARSARFEHGQSG